MCRERLLYSATDKGRYGTLGQIGPLSMHDVLGTEDFAPAEANIELDRMCGPIWTFGCSSTNFGTDMDARPFTDMARRKFSVPL